MATPSPLDVLSAKVKAKVKADAAEGVKPWVYLAIGIAILALVRSGRGR
jgi:hypothetical protein